MPIRDAGVMPNNLTTQTLLDAVLIVVLVGWMLYRQMTWSPVDPGRLWRMPLILAGIGVLLVFQQKATGLTALDLAVLAGELALSLGIGAAMGAIAHFRPMTAEAVASHNVRRAARGRSAVEHPVVFESRTGWLGAILWVVLIALRVGIDLGARHLGAEAVTSTGMILLVLGANRIARVAVFSYRLNRHPAMVSSGSSR